MATGGEAELFEGLPELVSPERGGGRGAARLRMAERRQVELRAISLEDLVPADHRVRLVWRFVEGLDLSGFQAAIKAVEGQPGHPPADPRILVALWLFATIEGIGSARAVARLCDEHIAYQWLAYQWLCGGGGMNAKTLADFRVDHGTLLERLLVDSFTALVRAGVASLDRIAQDGVRVRASAGAASFRRDSTLEGCRSAAEQAVRDLRAEVNGDPGALSRRQAAARQRAAEERERRVREALAVTRELRAQQEEKARREAERAARQAATAGEAAPAKERPKEPRASTTDAQARIMKMADGGYRPAYNVQFASDTRSGAIAGVSVDTVGSDMGKMAPMNEALAADYGQRPGQHLADGGFAKLADIADLAHAGGVVYVPVPTPRNAERDRYAPLPGDPPEVAAWRERMNTDDAKAIYKERAQTAECANAQARNRGLKQFLVRGLEAVTATALWYALAHNMACTWRLVWA
jgi:transposase